MPLGVYGARERAFARKVAHYIIAYHKQLNLEKFGLSPIAITGSILEEYHDLEERYGYDRVLNYIGDRELDNANESQLRASYKKTGDFDKKFDFEEKRNNPTTITAGPAGIQVNKAINLLEHYYLSHPNSDPLSIKKFRGRPKALVNALLDDDNPRVIAAIASLVVQDAGKWLSSNVHGWNDLKAAERDGLAVWGYNVGIAAMRKKKAEHLKTHSVYRPDVQNTDIAQEFILNRRSLGILHKETPPDVPLSPSSSEDQYFKIKQNLPLDSDDSASNLVPSLSAVPVQSNPQNFGKEEVSSQPLTRSPHTTSSGEKPPSSFALPGSLRLPSSSAMEKVYPKNRVQLTEPRRKTSIEPPVLPRQVLRGEESPPHNSPLNAAKLGRTLLRPSEPDIASLSEPTDEMIANNPFLPDARGKTNLTKEALILKKNKKIGLKLIQLAGRGKEFAPYFPEDSLGEDILT